MFLSVRLTAWMTEGTSVMSKTVDFLDYEMVLFVTLEVVGVIIVTHLFNIFQTKL